jgi:hypothetical protein
MLGRLRHLVEQAVRLTVTQMALQQRQVDLFFLGEMNSEQRDPSAGWRDVGEAADVVLFHQAASSRDVHIR